MRPPAHHEHIADMGGVTADQLEELMYAERGPDHIDPVLGLGDEGAVPG